MKRRDLVKKLREAGYELVRDDGNHSIFAKPGCASIPVPKHREINEILARSILKQIGAR